MPTHLIKLSVGSESIETMAAWQKVVRARYPDGLPRHITRMWPKRAEEVLAGGSIFWVVKGAIQCRQKVLRFDEAQGDDGILRCAFVLDPELVPVVPSLKRPFQGWRYLRPEDAPMDLPPGQVSEEALPAELSVALAEIGVL